MKLNVTFQKYIIYQDNKIALFLTIVSITWILGKVAFIGPNTHDNAFVTNCLLLLYTTQTVVFYYFLSFFVFPKYLYKYKIFPVILYLLLALWLAHQSNYITIKFLLPYSDDLLHGSTSKQAFVHKMYYTYLKDNRWFGCFTHPIIAYWTYGFSLEVATIFLAIRAIRDILTIQKRNLKLKIDKFRFGTR